MQAQLQQTPSNLKSIHLLRALLREATYLPDASARQYFRRYIVNRFRAYQPSQNATVSRDAQAVEKYRHRSFKRRNISIINERTRAMQRKGQKGLNFLRRANLGETACLEKILLFTYGRLGRRKYSLIEGLLRPDVPTEEDGTPEELLAPLQKLYYSNQRYLSFFDAPKKKSNTQYIIDISDRYSRLKTVIKSQSQNGIALGRDIKLPHLRTPIYNIWERPMPIKRARNNLKRWYAETMTSLLPPLPNEEWDNIKALSDGTKWISFVKRRIPIVEVDQEPVQEDDSLIHLVGEALALNKPSKVDKLAGLQKPHIITPRSIRRIYSKILKLCCKLEWDDEYKKWRAIWGSGPNSMNSRLYSAPVDNDLFAGVDDQGHIPKSPRSERTTEQKAGLKKERRKYTLVPFYVDFLPLDHPIRKEADAFRQEQRAAQSASAASRSGGEPA